MKFRVARHTTNLERIKHFYHNILGLEVLGSFENHDNYDGLFLGKKGESWHLEFTVSDEAPKHQIDPDDLLVFYPESEEVLNRIISGLKDNNILPIKSKNPYWNKHGVEFLDPDNFRIIISKETK